MDYSSKKTGPLTCSNDDVKKPPKNEWPPKAVEILVDMYVEKFSAGRTCLRSSDWEEIMERVNAECESFKNAKQCRDKVDSLKRRYKSEYRKFVNGDKITWPFFDKLDSLTSASKQMKSFELLDRLQKPVVQSSHEINEGDDETHDEKQGSPEDGGGVETRRGDTDKPFRLSFLVNGKSRPGEKFAISEEAVDVNAYPASPKLGRHTKVQHSPALSSEEEGTCAPPRLAPKTWRSASRRRCFQSEKGESDGSVHAIADALTGFAAIYAQIELTKKELMTKIELEFAKLGRKRRRIHHRKSASRASYTS